MATYAELRDRPDSRPVYWAEISGVGIFIAGPPFTADNIADYFSDGYTESLTVIKALEKPTFSYSKDLGLLKGESTTGGMTIRVTDVQDAVQPGDYPDGYFTHLFGSERSSILKVRATADIELHAGGAGHDWSAADPATAGFPAAPGLIYCGLETGRYASNPTATEFPDVTRSVFGSEASAHRGKRYGDQTLHKWITNHPTVWKGRIVTLFQTYVDGAGDIAYDSSVSPFPADTARSEAHKIVGILRDYQSVGGSWVLRCDGIETLLKRQIGRGFAKARLSPNVHVPARHASPLGNGGAVGSNGFVMMVIQEDGGGGEDFFTVSVTPASYQEDTFIQAVNDALGAGLTALDSGNVFRGQLSLSLTPDALMGMYLADAGNPRVVSINFDWTYEGNGDSPWPHMWQPMGLVLTTMEFNGGAITAGATEYPSAQPRGPRVVLPEIVSNDPAVENNGHQLRLMSESGDSPIADFETPAGEDYVMVESSVGREIMAVTSIVGSIINVSRQTNALGYDSHRLEHVATADQPVTVQRIYVNAAIGTEATQMLYSVLGLLLSTGAAGYSSPIADYNADDYDFLPEGVGIGFPSQTRNAGATTPDGLIDIESFERFLNAQASYYHGVRDIITEPISAREWLSKRIAFLGGYVVVENGQLKIRKGMEVLQHEGRTASYRQLVNPMSRTVGRKSVNTVGGLKMSYRWDLQNERFSRVTTLLVDNATSDLEDEIAEVEDKGISMDADRAIKLAAEQLADLGIENPEFSVTFDRSMQDLEVGQVVRLSDEGDGDTTQDNKLRRGLPNVDGTRGHTDVPMLVVHAEVDHENGEVPAILMQTRRKRGGWSPTANIKTFANNTPSAGTCRLECQQQFFSAVEDGRDVSRFKVGEKVKIDRGSAPTAAVTESAGHTISAIDVANNRIEIQPNPAGAGIVSGEFLVLVHDDYQTASQPSSAKAWCAIGDASGDIGDTGDKAYVW